MNNTDKNIWFPFSHLNSEKKEISHKLFCFHHAGGTASAYKPWAEYHKGVTTYPVELPGKATRMRETFITHYERLVPDIAKAIDAEVGETTFSLFGHSLGAIMAFKTAFILETLYKRKPATLIVAGRHAPQDDFKDPYQTYMGDDKLVEELKRVNGTPKDILANEEILKVLLPSIKNDYKLNESFDYKDEMLNTPIVAHVSNHDPDANPDQMERWKLVTKGDFKIKQFEGDHFFVHSLGENYYTEVAETAIEAGINRNN